jgi:hypothetical protein
MHIRQGFVLRRIGEGYVVVALGEAAETFRGIVRLNETGAFLFDAIQEGLADTNDGLVNLLTKNFDVPDAELASGDVSSFVRQLLRAGVLVDS